ncbi:hypothetical protein JCM10369A_00450 [Nocardioides pyridinolyticus]
MKDRRRRVLESAIFGDLTYGEKVYLITVATIRPEYVDGRLRPGSKSMGPDGKYALHLDYLAGALGTSPTGVRKMRQSLERKGYLQWCHDGTFGRPPMWQAMVVRVPKNGRVTAGENRHPYGLAEWVTRMADSATLTYRTPDDSNHPPASGALPTASNHVEAARRELAELPVRFPLTGCIWHEHFCPDDCAKQPESREAS